MTFRVSILQSFTSIDYPWDVALYLNGRLIATATPDEAEAIGKDLIDYAERIKKASKISLEED